jgi:hypothetical protein
MFPKIIFGVSLIFSVFIMPFFWTHDANYAAALPSIWKQNDTILAYANHSASEYLKVRIGENYRYQDWGDKHDTVEIAYNYTRIFLDSMIQKTNRQESLSAIQIDSVTTLEKMLRKTILGKIGDKERRDWETKIPITNTIKLNKNNTPTEQRIVLETIKNCAAISTCQIYNYISDKLSSTMNDYKYGIQPNIKDFIFGKNRILKGNMAISIHNNGIKNTQIWVNDTLLDNSFYGFTPQRTGAHTFHVKALVQTKDSTITLRDTFSVYVDK